MQCTNIALKEGQRQGKTDDELDKLRWNENKLEFLTALLDVFDDKSVRFFYLKMCFYLKTVLTQDVIWTSIQRYLSVETMFF